MNVAIGLTGLFILLVAIYIRLGIIIDNQREIMQAIKHNSQIIYNSINKKL